MDDEDDVHGLTVSDLQSDVIVNESDIVGTLKWVTDYTGFNELDETEQSGNYIALSISDTPDEATVTTELVNGNTGVVDITDNLFYVYRITDKDSQKIKITATVGADSETKIYDLSKLTLNEQ